MRQIILDTETTGLSAQEGDRIIEIGCVELVNRKLTGRHFHVYINPQRASHPDALKIHGLSEAFLKDKPLFSEIADSLQAYLEQADELIIHNASFDMGFLNAELQRLSKPLISTYVGRVVDTLLMAKEMFPGKRNNLDALCDRMGIDRSERTLHGALLDAELLADVYIAMTRGQKTLHIEASSQSDNHRKNSTVLSDSSRLHLPVIEPNSKELEAHQKMLDQMQAAGETPLWRSIASIDTIAK